MQILYSQNIDTRFWAGKSSPSLIPAQIRACRGCDGMTVVPSVFPLSARPFLSVVSESPHKTYSPNQLFLSAPCSSPRNDSVQRY